MSAKFQFKGLEEVKKKLERINQRARRAKVIEEFSEEVRLKLVETIEKQGFKHQGLTKDWAAKKRRMGLDPRILIADGEYVGSIFSGQTSTGFFVSTPDSMAKLAGWLEFGTRRMTARPHWRPVMAWAGRRWDLITEKFGKDILK